ncbi:MAG: hypothetical protein HC795_03065, partial [Coleofasciculaceae cyanobacterium RL_1_1]|nr:hypothetical protein [Coleofasciculaceae cyanobacterium RL_1_1]
MAERFNISPERTRKARQLGGISLDLDADNNELLQQFYEDAAEDIEVYGSMSEMSEIAEEFESNATPEPAIDEEFESNVTPEPVSATPEAGIDEEFESNVTPEPVIDLENILENITELEPEVRLSPAIDPETVPDRTTDIDPDIDLGSIVPRDQVYLKVIGDRVFVILPLPVDELDAVIGLTWQEVQQQLSLRLNSGERFWSPEARVTLIAGNRFLDNSQLQDLEETLAHYDLALSRVQTSRRETAIAAVTAGYSVDQQALQQRVITDNPSQSEIDRTPASLALAEPLYMRTTVRSGVEVRRSRLD